MISLLSVLFILFPQCGGWLNFPSWSPIAALQQVSGGPAGTFLATFDTSWDWRLIVELATFVAMLIFALKPQPPLHQQFASREEVQKQKAEVDKHKDEIWVVVNGLRGSVSHIKTSIEQIKTLREANGDRLDEVSRELMQLIKEVARLNERTEHYFTKEGRN